MQTSVFVVSDLHLGGGEAFRICPTANQQRLAELFSWIASQRSATRDVQLVLNGDVVDFLAEPDRDGTWSAFTADEGLALEKLERILSETSGVWDALAELVAKGCALTILLGNHDVELCFPKLRRRFLERVGADRGRVQFLYDNQAFTLGKLLVEHGNRYEGWNVVAHDALRRVRSRLSRGEPAGSFPAQPGSKLVAEIMNPLKRRFGFVDLLKPETSGVVPILAVLDPGAWRRIGPAIREAAYAAWRQAQLDPEGRATAGEFIRAGSGPAAAAVDDSLGVSTGSRAAPAAPPGFPDEDALRAADELATPAGGARGELISASRVAVTALLLAFRKRREKDGSSFAIDSESDAYLEPARALAARGHEVVVLGHTHHAKRVSVGGATYLNTGTWADLMRIPQAVYEGDMAAGEAALRAWLDDLESNHIDRYRRLVPTFARVDLDGEAIEARDVFFFDGPGHVEPISTKGVLARIGLQGSA